MVWRAGTSAFDNSHVRAAAYSGSKYVAVGAGRIASSTNGVTWTENTAQKSNWANPNDYVDFYGIAYGGGKFVAVGYWANGDGGAGWGVAAVSADDGVTWTMQANVLSFGGETISPKIYGITFGNGKFVAVGRWGRSAYSANGSSWTAAQIGSFNYLDNPLYYEDALSVAHGDGKFVVVGRNGKVAFSGDAAIDWKWVANALIGIKDINSIAFGNNTFIAAGNGGGLMRVASSQVVEGTGDNGGNNWEAVDGKFDTTHIFGVAYGGAAGVNRFIAVGDNGKMSESPDGATWTAINTGTGATQNQFTGEERINCVISGGGKFIAGGNAYSGNASKIVYSE
ncbi:hypothetical protein AGMMS50267_15120 [Spirochaetia bacterium]|nr:hypothetical protein AGMMS50267_15120 [Spirochaetia bacterium]